jgi:hypothetical protein
MPKQAARSLCKFWRDAKRDLYVFLYVFLFIYFLN